MFWVFTPFPPYPVSPDVSFPFCGVSLFQPLYCFFYKVFSPKKVPQSLIPQFAMVLLQLFKKNKQIFFKSWQSMSFFFTSLLFPKVNNFHSVKAMWNSKDENEPSTYFDLKISVLVPIDGLFFSISYCFPKNPADEVFFGNFITGQFCPDFF